MISENINKEIAQALKEKEEVRLSTLRMLSSALHNAEIDKRGKLNEDEELAVVKREIRMREDAIEGIKQAQGKGTFDPEGLKGKLDKEEKELEILKTYLPKQLGEDELREIVEETVRQTGATSMKDMGKVIGVVMGKVGNSADGKKVAELAKNKLSQ